MDENANVKGVAAKAEEYLLRNEVDVLKAQIKAHTSSLKERLDQFEKLASESLDAALESYSRVIHDALVDEELLKRAANNGFRTLLEGYRVRLQAISSALQCCDDERESYNNLLNSIKESIAAGNAPSAAASLPALAVAPLSSLDLKAAKDPNGPLLKPLLSAQSALSNNSAASTTGAAAAAAAGGRAESRVGGMHVSLSLEKLRSDQKQVPELLQIALPEPKEKRPMIQALQFGDVAAGSTRTPALFVADTSNRVCAFNITAGTLPERRLLASIERPVLWGEPGGVLPVLGSRHLLVNEKQAEGDQHAVVLYEWKAANAKLRAERSCEPFALVGEQSDGTAAWLIPKKLEDTSATFYAAAVEGRVLHELRLSTAAATPQFNYCTGHKLKGPIRSLGYRLCTDGAGDNIRIVVCFYDDTSVHVYDSTADCSAPTARTIDLGPPPSVGKAGAWSPSIPLPLGDQLVLVSDENDKSSDGQKKAGKKGNDRAATARAFVAAQKSGAGKWLFEKLDSPTGPGVSVWPSAWCLAQLPATSPAAVLLVANDVAKELEFYQLVLHTKS